MSDAKRILARAFDERVDIKLRIEALLWIMQWVRAGGQV